MKATGPITVTIRSAMPSDYELCARFDHSVSTEYVWQMVTDELEGAQQVTFRLARLPRSIKVLYPRTEETLYRSWQMHTIYLVAEWEKELIGYANLRAERGQDAAWIADLVIDSPFRLRGVGGELLRAAREWALEQGMRRLICETQTKNYPAIRFLQKRGMRFCGFSELYYPNQDIALFFGQTLR